MTRFQLARRVQNIRGDAATSACVLASNTPARKQRHLTWGALALLGLASLASSGCTACCAPAAMLKGPGTAIHNGLAYNEGVDSMILGWRNKVAAKKAWAQRCSCFENHPYCDHFGQGFIDGYIATVSGGNGCVPNFAPRSYWSWRYQTPEGQAKVAAWFEGWPHGARAAEEDGLGNWSGIQTSYALERNSGCNTCPLGYPVQAVPSRDKERKDHVPGMDPPRARPNIPATPAPAPGGNLETPMPNPMQDSPSDGTRSTYYDSGAPSEAVPSSYEVTDQPLAPAASASLPTAEATDRPNALRLRRLPSGNSPSNLRDLDTSRMPR